jgi:hypothetical protein
VAEQGRHVGRPTPRIEDARLVTGEARWTASLRVEGALHLAVARSPLAHARLARVDVSAALAAPAPELELPRLSGKGVGALEDYPFEKMTERLRELIPAWTGNHCHVFELNQARLTEHIRARDPIVDEWRRDAVRLVGDELRQMLRRLSHAGGGK